MALSFYQGPEALNLCFSSFALSPSLCYGAEVKPPRTASLQRGGLTLEAAQEETQVRAGKGPGLPPVLPWSVAYSPSSSQESAPLLGQGPSRGCIDEKGGKQLLDIWVLLLQLSKQLQWRSATFVCMKAQK